MWVTRPTDKHDLPVPGRPSEQTPQSRGSRLALRRKRKPQRTQLIAADPGPAEMRSTRTGVRCWAASPGLVRWARTLSMRITSPVSIDSASAVLRICPPPYPSCRQRSADRQRRSLSCAPRRAWRYANPVFTGSRGCPPTASDGFKLRADRRLTNREARPCLTAFVVHDVGQQRSAPRGPCTAPRTADRAGAPHALAGRLGVVD